MIRCLTTCRSKPTPWVRAFPHFSHSVKDVTDEVGAGDGIVGPDLPMRLSRNEVEAGSTSVAVGFDNIDIACRRHEFSLPRPTGTMEVADHAMALMLTLMKTLPR
jgi:phosphoglycerate dehydrogenase-like enzyme